MSNEILVYAGASTTFAADLRYRAQALACLNFRAVSFDKLEDVVRPSTPTTTSRNIGISLSPAESDRSDLVPDSQVVIKDQKSALIGLESRADNLTTFSLSPDATSRGSTAHVNLLATLHSKHLPGSHGLRNEEAHIETHDDGSSSGHIPPFVSSLQNSTHQISVNYEIEFSEYLSTQAGQKVSGADVNRDCLLENESSRAAGILNSTHLTALPPPKLVSMTTREAIAYRARLSLQNRQRAFTGLQATPPTGSVPHLRSVTRGAIGHAVDAKSVPPSTCTVLPTQCIPDDISAGIGATSIAQSGLPSSIAVISGRPVDLRPPTSGSPLGKDDINSASQIQISGGHTTSTPNGSDRRSIEADLTFSLDSGHAPNSDKRRHTRDTVRFDCERRDVASKIAKLLDERRCVVRSTDIFTMAQHVAPFYQPTMNEGSLLVQCETLNAIETGGHRPQEPDLDPKPRVEESVENVLDAGKMGVPPNHIESSVSAHDYKQNPGRILCALAAASASTPFKAHLPDGTHLVNKRLGDSDVPSQVSEKMPTITSSVILTDRPINIGSFVQRSQDQIKETISDIGIVLSPALKVREVRDMEKIDLKPTGTHQMFGDEAHRTAEFYRCIAEEYRSGDRCFFLSIDAVDSDPPLIPAYLTERKVPAKLFKRCKDIEPLDRGRWCIDLQSLGFTMQEAAVTWNGLCEIIRIRKLHWVTLQFVKNTFRVYCFGNCAPQVWVIIYAVARKIKQGIPWIDSAGRQAVFY